MGSLVPTIGKIWTIHCPAIQSRNVQFGSNSNQSLKTYLPTGTMPRSKGKAHASKGIKEDNAEASKGGNEDLQRSIQRAQLLGVKKATEKVGVPKKYLSARPLGPLEKEDGSFFSVEEVVAVESKDPSNDLDQVLKGGVEDEQEEEAIHRLKLENDMLKTKIEELRVRKARLKSVFASQQKRILELTDRLGFLSLASFDLDYGEDGRYSKKDG